MLDPSSRPVSLRVRTPQSERRAHRQLARFLAGSLLVLAASVRPEAAAASQTRTLSQSPTNINFGTVQDGGSATQQFTLTNTGNSAVKITKFNLRGPEFSLSGPQLPYTLSAGDSVSVSVTFAPTKQGSANGGALIVSNATNSPIAVDLSGTGALSLQLGAAPTSIGFGDVNVGSNSSVPVVMTNTGSGSITVSQVTLTGAGFSFSGLTLPVTLASGQNATLDAVFAPASGGSVTGSMSVISNATNSPAVVSLSGTGANSYSVSLSWDPSGSNDVAGYNVYRGSGSGGPYTEINSLLVAGTTYTDTTVQDGQTYYYVTTAVDSEGHESVYSNQVQASVPSS